MTALIDVKWHFATCVTFGSSLSSVLLKNRDVGIEGAGGIGGAHAPFLVFGRSVNPILTGGKRLCLYYLPHGFLDLPTALKMMTNTNPWEVIECLSIHSPWKSPADRYTTIFFIMWSNRFRSRTFLLIFMLIWSYNLSKTISISLEKNVKSNAWINWNVT